MLISLVAVERRDGPPSQMAAKVARRAQSLAWATVQRELPLQTTHLTPEVALVNMLVASSDTPDGSVEMLRVGLNRFAGTLSRTTYPELLQEGPLSQRPSS